MQCRDAGTLGRGVGKRGEHRPQEDMNRLRAGDAERQRSLGSKLREGALELGPEVHRPDKDLAPWRPFAFFSAAQAMLRTHNSRAREPQREKVERALEPRALVDFDR